MSNQEQQTDYSQLPPEELFQQFKANLMSVANQSNMYRQRARMLEQQIAYAEQLLAGIAEGTVDPQQGIVYFHQAIGKQDLDEDEAAEDG